MGTDLRRPWLVLRFAIASLVVFAAVGAGVGWALVRNARERAEAVATFHARFVASAVLGPALSRIDLSHPLTGIDLATIDAMVRGQILSDGRDVRVKVWSPDGTVLYSDDRSIIGRSFPEDPELREAIAGEPVGGVTDLNEAENAGDRALGSKLFENYLPIRDGRGAPAVLELYQSYAAIQADVDSTARTLLITFGVGLLLLYAALLPIASRAARQLTDRNRRLSTLLAREQETVAELRELSRMKGDFAAAASHELRTPLTAILGYIRTLRRPEFAADPVARGEFLSAAEQQGNRLLRLIRRLLTSSRLENEEPVLDLEPVDLRELVLAVRDELPGGERIALDLPVGMPPAETDRKRMQEVLVELLDNAIKYSPDGGPVELGARLEEGELRLWVRDHGVGIPPDAGERVFDRFYQADQSSTRRFGGMGLGLYLVRALVGELGGAVSVRSEAGRGSTFTVSLPQGASHPSVRVG